MAAAAGLGVPARAMGVTLDAFSALVGIGVDSFSCPGPVRVAPASLAANSGALVSVGGGGALRSFQQAMICARSISKWKLPATKSAIRDRGSPRDMRWMMNAFTGSVRICMAFVLSVSGHR